VRSLRDAWVNRVIREMPHPSRAGEQPVDGKSREAGGGIGEPEPVIRIQRSGDNRLPGLAAVGIQIEPIVVAMHVQ
jgi:hypothetical protein